MTTIHKTNIFNIDYTNITTIQQRVLFDGFAIGIYVDVQNEIFRFENIANQVDKFIKQTIFNIDTAYTALNMPVPQIKGELYHTRIIFCNLHWNIPIQ